MSMYEHAALTFLHVILQAFVMQIKTILKSLLSVKPYAFVMIRFAKPPNDTSAVRNYFSNHANAPENFSRFSS